LLWNEWDLMACSDDEIFGGDNFSFKGDSGAGIGFYSAILSGFLLMVLYFRLPKKEQESTIQTPVKSAATQGPLDNLQSVVPPEEEWPKPDKAREGMKLKSGVGPSLLTGFFLLIALIGVFLFLFGEDLFGTENYSVTDHTEETTNWSDDNLLMIENTFDGVYSDQITITIVTSNGDSFQCLPNGFGCNLYSLSEDGLDAWSQGEVWVIQEDGVNICGADGCSIRVYVVIDGETLEGPRFVSVE